MTDRIDRFKARLHEDASGDVLRGTVANHKLKSMEGKKKSQALVDKLTKRVAAGKRHMTEETVAKKVAKPVKPLTNNPGYGYHGIAHTKHKGDANKAHAEYNKMHAKVKDWAGEAGHLVHSKKPNVMVRDYLDSKRGRHLEGLEADDKYIKKDFGHFARSYDPKLFVESIDPDIAGIYTHQQRNGTYKNVRIKAVNVAGKPGYHIHHADGSVTKTDQKGAKDFIARNNAQYVKEDVLEEGTKRHNITAHVNVLKKHGYKETENHPDMKRSWHRELVHPKTGHFAIVDAIHAGGTNTEIAHPTKDGEHNLEHTEDLHKHLTKLHGVNEETINETTKSEDAQRVQYGVMKREDYLKKWKIGRFDSKQHPLSGPGGVYKNLVGRSLDDKSLATRK